jgi:nitrous oxidase accessory protein
MTPPTRTLLAAAVMTIAGAMPGTTAAQGERGSWLRARIATAAAGAVVDVPPGRYVGPFTIDRPMTLRGAGQAVLVGDRATHVVAIRAADVTLEGFEIRGSGIDLAGDHAGVHVTGARATIRGNHIVDSLHGIYVRQADGVRIQDNRIVGLETGVPRDRRGNGVHIWRSTNVEVSGNVIRGTRDGIYFSFVSASDVTNNDVADVRYGLHYMYSDRNRFDGNRFHENAAGAALMFSKSLTLTRNSFAGNRSQRAYGLLLQSVDDTVVSGNDIRGNTVGLFIENGQANRVLDNRIAGNHVGIHVSASAGANVFAGNRFTGNLHPIETSGGSGGNRWVLEGRGNAWQEPVAIDLDRDGIGDVPHRELDLFGGLRRQLPAIGLLAGSPAERLLRWVDARVPLPGVGVVVDPAPLVTGGAR